MYRKQQRELTTSVLEGLHRELIRGIPDEMYRHSKSIDILAKTQKLVYTTVQKPFEYYSITHISLQEIECES